MSLVPIIYTSLLIFSALLLFVIITSYISFKLKPKKNLVYQHIEPERQIKINRIHNYQQPSSIIVKNYTSNSMVRESSTNKTHLQNFTSKSENPNFSNTLQRNTKRLEIMNSNEKFQKTVNTIQPKLQFEQSYNSVKRNFRITDANILDFYSDNSIKNYSSFTTI